jgi:hypothetical protein
MDRDALIELADRHLDALASGGSRALPQSPACRGTENGLPVAPGSGLLHKADAIPGRQFFADGQSGHVVAMGAARIDAVLRPYMLRLRLINGELVESEAIVSTDAHGHFADVDQLLSPDILYDAPVPGERACDRDELRTVVDTYWIALEQSDGSMIRCNQRCDRFANGKKITSNLSILRSPDAAVHTVASCLYATRPARPRVLERRFPVLDAERGVGVSVVSVAFGPPPGNPRPDVGVFYMLGAFKVVDREFRVIDEIHEILPPGSRSGW